MSARKVVGAIMLMLGGFLVGLATATFSPDQTATIGVLLITTIIGIVVVGIGWSLALGKS